MDGLIKAIRHTNLGIRWRAALALGDIGEPAIKPLIRALKEDDQDVRWLAGLALGRIGQAAIPQLIRALRMLKNKERPAPTKRHGNIPL